VVDSGGEGNLWWLERIIDWEVDVQEEKSSLIWRVFWSSDGGLPVVEVRAIDWSSGAGERWVFLKVVVFL
jgi:hypothetical protein